jgi:hypothetical protein
MLDLEVFGKNSVEHFNLAVSVAIALFTDASGILNRKLRIPARCQYSLSAVPRIGSEECEICTHYDGCHGHHVKHNSYLSPHFSYLPISVYYLLPRLDQTAGWAEHSKELLSVAFVTNNLLEEILYPRKRPVLRRSKHLCSGVWPSV